MLSVVLFIGWLWPLSRLDSGVEMHSERSDLILLLTADKTVYAEGEPVELTLQVVNRGPRPVTLQFRDSQRYDFLIRNAQGQEVWRWSADQMFAQMLGQETLSPDGGNLTYRVVARATLRRGSYTVMGVVPAIDAQMSALLEVTMQ
jgi:intracellular proteinase inhibitor BsuPI